MTATPPPSSLSSAEDARWTEVRRLADLLDTRFRIPGTRQTFGLDAILGIIPGAGDLAGLVASAVVVTQAVRLGARGWMLASMLLNMALDATVGTVPVAGTVFDVVYKANTRTVRLLEQHLEDPATARARARRSVLRSLVAVMAITVLVAVLVVATVVWLLRVLF